MDYEEMTVEELEEENLRLMGEKDKIRAEQLKIKAVLDKKVALRDAERKLATLSDSEKRALLQVIHTQGIPSAEEFGKL